MEQFYRDKLIRLGYNQLVCDIFPKWEDVKDEILVPERKSGTGNGTIHVFLGAADYELQKEFSAYYHAVNNGEDPSVGAIEVKHFFLASNVLSMLGYVCQYYFSKGQNSSDQVKTILSLLSSYPSENGLLETNSFFKLSTGASRLRPYFKQFDNNGVFTKLIRQLLLPNSGYKISLYKNVKGEYAAFWLIGFDWLTNFEANSNKSLFSDKQLHEYSKKSLQQIFYGAPGTGKSHKIKDDKNVTEADKKNLVFRTTFHPDSDYSTFVGCYKPFMSKTIEKSTQPILDYDSLVDKFKEYLTVPNVNITKACTLFGYDYHDSIIRIQENGHKVMDLVNDAYKSNTSYDSVVRGGMACYEQNPIKDDDSKITYQFVAQAFTNAYVEAWNTEKEVYLVIEEINRGNCAQIFGDLFQLLDRKNGVSEYPVEADADLQSYLNKALAKTSRTDIPADVKLGKKLMLPSNLYIWATMNTSDQSLFPIDSAFKRRWEWKYIKIKEGKDENGNKLEWKVNVKMDEAGNLLPWWAFIQKINEIIASMTSSADKQLGYFFCCAKDGVIDEETFVSKVIFYLWNDVFKDYGFEDASLFRYTDNDSKEKDLTFPDFYDEDGEKVNTERLTDFVKKVMNWKKTSEKNN